MAAGDTKAWAEIDSTERRKPDTTGCHRRAATVDEVHPRRSPPWHGWQQSLASNVGHHTYAGRGSRTMHRGIASSLSASAPCLIVWCDASCNRPQRGLSVQTISYRLAQPTMPNQPQASEGHQSAQIKGLMVRNPMQAPTTPQGPPGHQNLRPKKLTRRHS